MSSNRARLLTLLAAAAALGACASHAPVDPHVADTPLTPTQRFAPVVTETPDQVLLAPHATGLSAAQTAAVDALVQRWRTSGGGAILIRPPAGGLFTVGS